MKALASSAWVYTAVTLLSTFASSAWLDLASRFFSNLSVYLLHAGEKDERVEPEQPKKKKKNKQQNKKHFDFPYLAVVKLSRAASYEIKYFSTFDQSVTLLFGIAANCIATWALGDRVGRNTMLPGMCAVSFLLCVYNTLNTVFLDQTTGRYERYGLVLLFGLGVAGTYWLLMSRPEIVLGDRAALDSSVEGTMAAAQDLLRRKGVLSGAGAGAGAAIAVPRHLTLTLVASLAGHVTSCVFSSALRVAQSYYMAFSSSSSQQGFAWGAKYLQRPAWVRALWHLAMVAPIALAAAGLARPSVGGGLAQSSCCLACVCCHLAVLRPLLQAFLDRGLVEWYETKHSTDEAETSRALAKYLKSALQRRLYVLGKVSVQGLTLPLLLTSLAPLGLGPARAALGGDPRAPPFVWEVVASYLLWWASLCWSIIFLVSLYLRRAGVFR
mmetsp:Transcript_10310/g.36624  ORF Transcript_10310/g.36624 Transcript_10310/m.36624 type:complete len:440 (+) Transcript_10310:136-1455(+)